MRKHVKERPPPSLVVLKGALPMGALSRDYNAIIIINIPCESWYSEKLIDYGSYVMHCIIVTIHCVHVWLLGYCCIVSQQRPGIATAVECQELAWVSLYGCIMWINFAIAVPWKWDILNYTNQIIPGILFKLLQQWWDSCYGHFTQLIAQNLVKELGVVVWQY